jgi:hypothetical protein
MQPMSCTGTLGHCEQLKMETIKYVETKWKKRERFKMISSAYTLTH